MEFPWLPLTCNLVLLGLVLFICRTLNASRGTLTWNGALVFLLLCVLALLLDFALTMIFASVNLHERTPYDALGSRTAWSERVLAYLIPCAISLALAWRFRKRQRFALGRARRDGRERNGVASFGSAPTR